MSNELEGALLGVTMLLIRFNVWWGPSKDYSHEVRMGRKPDREPEIKQEAYATRLSLLEALRRVRMYERAFEQKYGRDSVVEFTLLGVDTIEELDEEGIELARVRLIEDDLRTDPKDF